MTKKIIALMLSLVMICQFALTSCGKPEKPNVDNGGADAGDDNGETVEIPSHDALYKDVPDRFKTAYTIDRAKLEMAAAAEPKSYSEWLRRRTVSFPVRILSIISTCTE